MNHRRLWRYGWLWLVASLLIFLRLSQVVTAMSAPFALLTDPFLQFPTPTSVQVVWFTEFAGSQHFVSYGVNLQQRAIATTTQLSRTREDADSHLTPTYDTLTQRPIWRHAAIVTGLPRNTRLPYSVTSVHRNGAIVRSDVFSLSSTPTPGQPLKLLLTSDHQLKPLAAANYQKVVETIGQVDAVLFAGDLVNIPDRASEWFDDNRGAAFFPVLQGRAHYDLRKQEHVTRYRGGALIQSAPLFPATGNHEVMGRFSATASLDDQFNDSVPRQAAAALYEQQSASLNPTNDATLRENWIKQYSFNTDTYEEIFSLPENPTGDKNYYAVTFGDLRLVVLYITNMWRSPSLAPTARGRYRERQADLNNPIAWGHGQHIFGAIARGTPQHNWLKQELTSPEFRQAKYKVVMFHHPPHTLGDNIVPAYTDPIPVIERDPDSTITAVRYEYPLESDYIVRDVLPLLEAAGVQLVYYGHSHLWNRFVSPNGTHYLESSNVGNSYGASLGDRPRSVPRDYQEVYVATGNPNGLEPVVPTIAPLLNDQGQPQPYLASNDITAFSILDTATGSVSSYRFDTRDPTSAVVKFDEFTLRK